MKRKSTKIVTTFIMLCIIITTLTIPVFANEIPIIFTLSTMEDDMNEYEVYQIVVKNIAEDGSVNFTWGKNGIGSNNESNEVSSEIISTLSNSKDYESVKIYLDKEVEKFDYVSNTKPLSVPSGFYLVKFPDDSWNIMEITGDCMIVDENEEDKVEEIVATLDPNEEFDSNVDNSEVEGSKNVESDINDDKTPIVIKRVKQEDGKFRKAVDAGVGDEVVFELTGTFPRDFELYQKYYYKFEDVLPERFTYVEDSVKIVAGIIFNKEDFNVTYDKNVLTIEIPDLRNVPLVDDTQEISVTYKAVLKDGIENENESNVKLHFSDMELMTTEDFYAVARGKMEIPVNTTEEIGGANVYSYQLVVNNVDENGKTLEGAGFRLEEKVSEDVWKIIGEEICVADENSSVFKWNGIDEGKYRLTETTIPHGYSGIAPVEFEVRSEIGEDGKLMGLEAEVLKGSAMYDVFADVNNGVIMAKVKEIEVPTWNEMKGSDIVKMILGVVGFK